MGLVVICLAVGTAVPATAADPAFNHRCRWWNDWCNNTTTTTTLPPAPTTTTAAPTTTTTTAPTTTTTAAPTTTTTAPRPSTTTVPPTTTTTTLAITTTAPRPSTTTVPPTTTTTLATTSTTSAETVGFYADFDLHRGQAAQVASIETAAPTPVQLLVTLAAGFVGMTVQGLGYYLFAFLVPITAAIWLGIVRRREDSVLGEMESLDEAGPSES